MARGAIIQLVVILITLENENSISSTSNTSPVQGSKEERKQKGKKATKSKQCTLLDVSNSMEEFMQTQIKFKTLRSKIKYKDVETTIL